MKLLLAILAVISMTGCASFRDAYLENRVVCTVGQDKAFVVSQWGPVGITAEISAKDQGVICVKAN